jgi:hypothetical protein
MIAPEAREALTGRVAQAIAITVVVFTGLWLVHDPTDAIWGEPGSGHLFASFRQEGAPVLGGAQGTTSGAHEADEGEPQPTRPAHDDRDGGTAPADGDGDAPPTPEVGATPAALSDPGGRGLAHFRESLRKGGLTRVLHFGDSLIDTDFVAGTARRLLQKRFGDGGHGFLNVGRPWDWYRHWDVEHHVRGDWSHSVATFTPAPDHKYGLAGARFRPRGGIASFGTMTEGDFGRRVSRFEIAYAKRPEGGTIVLKLDGHERRVSTASPDRGVGYEELRVPDGPHTLELTGARDGEALVYGVVMERDRGVVYDNLGLNGARVRILAGFDEPTWTDQLRRRGPDLVILGFGLNEAENEHFPVGRWPELVTVVERVRRAVPEASCLLVGPPDRVDRSGAGLVSPPVVRRITTPQREVALEHGCAYFDLQAAMGGEGSAARWARQRPRLVAGDYTHVTPEGAARLGELLVEALTAGLPRVRGGRGAP